MWLINTNTLKLEEFHICPTKKYAILSHTWGDPSDEPTFEEFVSGAARANSGFEKIRLCCEQAKREGITHVWVDTVCIDKRYSTELSEAINSMFQWYRQSKVCYVYLSDISDSIQPDPLTLSDYTAALQESRWFERGWTLQELIAPDIVKFFTQRWVEIGDKSLLANCL